MTVFAFLGIAFLAVGQGFVAFPSLRLACKSSDESSRLRLGSDVSARLRQQEVSAARPVRHTVLHASVGAGGEAAAAVFRVVRNFVAGETAVSLTFGTVLLSLMMLVVRRLLWKPSRTYNRDENSVGREYDAWATEGILEAYWGEHIHLGYYSDTERARGYKKKDFIQAKYDFIDEMMSFGKIGTPRTILDVGCGIGGKRYFCLLLSACSYA